ncbi:HNH endonuclease [Elizabethkingia ursingii]|uniref:HNH endonuclease 5 domain-containing protein n=1 Tax=Elizabethkingia ursingii TaxID=1756150 RepID=A0ABX3N3F7_9FLAO|nr:HNH endonuclease [Elizabethkingia ursingii]OPB84419.1 hypothetical protein BB021_16895 [Elizabethkingia ursingii]
MENKFQEEINTIIENYQLIGHMDISKVLSKRKVLDKSGKCRFCGKDSSETTFKTESHILPQFIGNKFVVSNFECDQCNEKFSRILENDFANFMKLFHTINGIKGGKKIPTYKKNGIRISTSDGNHFKIEGIDDTSINDKGIHFRSESDEFIPIAVYKMLTKIALSMVNETQISNFSKTLSWLQEETHSSPEFNNGSFPLIITINKNNSEKFNISVLLAKKKSRNSPIPSYIFKLYYNIFSFQIFIPFIDDDCDIKNLSESNMLKIIPNSFEIEHNEDVTLRYYMNCNMNQKGTVSIDINIDNLKIN